jgi:putative transcriptional regulator
VGCGIDGARPAGALTVRNRLRELRAERGWSQGALADRLDVSRQTVNALETGRYDPSLPLAFRIAALFDSRIESIFLPEDAVPADPSAPTAPPAFPA